MDDLWENIIHGEATTAATMTRSATVMSSVSGLSSVETSRLANRLSRLRDIGAKAPCIYASNLQGQEPSALAGGGGQLLEKLTA